MYCWITVNRQRHSERVRILRGIFQGSILSPLLFNLFIDTLARQFSKILLYADDIAIKAATVREAQAILLRCEEWAKLNGMSWNVAKCGVVGTDHVFILNNQRIPALDEYKYLGFPHSSGGLRIEAHFEARLERHDAFVRSLLYDQDSWSLSSRLIVYKTFAAPILDYGAGIFSIWLRKQKPAIRDRWIKRLESSWKLLSEFLVETDHCQAASNTMVGLCPDLKLDEWHASLVRQMSRLPEGHVLRDIEPTARLDQDRDYVVSSIFSRPRLLTSFDEINRNLPDRQKIAWRRYLAETRLNANLAKPGVLQHYIHPESRPRQWGDSVLHAPNREIQRKAIRWRLNRCFINSRCVCGERFTRSHVDHLLPPEILTSKLYEDYLNSSTPNTILTQLLQKQKRARSAPTFVFSFLDHALNTSKFDTFKYAYDYISSQITR